MVDFVKSPTKQFLEIAIKKMETNIFHCKTKVMKKYFSESEKKFIFLCIFPNYILFIYIINNKNKKVQL